jgi:CHC2 zinc finger
VKKGVSPEKKLRRNGLDSPLISRVSTRKLANSRTDHPSSQHRRQAHDIMAAISRYVTLDERGVGSCPFKEHHYRGDLRPSFQVFGEPDPHWYCYTWRRAGNLFDFLCVYYQLTPQDVWRQVQCGALW